MENFLRSFKWPRKSSAVLNTPPPVDGMVGFTRATGAPRKRSPSVAQRRSNWSMNVACIDHPEHDMPCPHPDHSGDMTPEQVRAHIAEGLALAAANPYVRPEVARAKALESS